MNFTDYIKTYEDLAQQIGGMVFANEITKRPLELIGGNWEDEIFQFYNISDFEFLMEHTDKPVFFDSKLDLYLQGIMHFGKAQSCFATSEFH